MLSIYIFIQILDPTNFFRKQFRHLDIKCRNGFSKPIRNLQSELKNNILNKTILNNIKACVNKVKLDSFQAINRLVDINSSKSKSYRDMGDRKNSRKELAPFVKILNQYTLYILTDDDNIKIVKTSILSKIVNIFSLSKKISPSAHQIEAVETKTNDTEYATEVDTYDLQSMTHLYRKQLKMPLNDAFDIAKYSRISAEELLKICESEVLSAESIIKSLQSINNDHNLSEDGSNKADDDNGDNDDDDDDDDDGGGEEEKEVDEDQEGGEKNVVMSILDTEGKNDSGDLGVSENEKGPVVV